MKYTYKQLCERPVNLDDTRHFECHGVHVCGMYIHLHPLHHKFEYFLDEVDGFFSSGRLFHDRRLLPIMQKTIHTYACMYLHENQQNNF